MSYANDVIKFINDFVKYESNRVLTKTFTRGYCYWFAFVLKERFNGEIYYLPNQNHFLCKIDNNFYDISGIVQPDEKAYQWSVYQIQNSKSSERVKRYCVDKI